MRRFFFISLAVARVFRAEIPDESQFVQIQINAADDPAIGAGNSLNNDEHYSEPLELSGGNFTPIDGAGSDAIIFSKGFAICADIPACHPCYVDCTEKFNVRHDVVGGRVLLAIETKTSTPLVLAGALPASCHDKEHGSCCQTGQNDAVVSAVPIVASSPGTNQLVPNNLNLDWADGVRDGNFTYNDNASVNSRIYNLDTGVNCWHRELSGRCVKGWDAYFAPRYGPNREGANQLGSPCRTSSYRCAHDKNGHGTHTAGTNAAGLVGIAKEAAVVAVKVLDDRGNAAVSQIVAGLYWAVDDCRNFPPPHAMGCVISMSVGVQGRITAFRLAIDDALAAGVTTVVAAGNGNGNACNYSPGFVASAITVGSAEDIGNANRVRRSSFSNYGICVDIWAIGTEVNSIAHDGKSTAATLSGTSMAAPLVAGAVAIFMGQGFNSSVFAPVERLNALARPGMVQQLPINFNNKFLRVASENFQP